MNNYASQIAELNAGGNYQVIGELRSDGGHKWVKCHSYAAVEHFYLCLDCKTMRSHAFFNSKSFNLSGGACIKEYDEMVRKAGWEAAPI